MDVLVKEIDVVDKPKPVTREQLWNTAQQLKHKENDGKNKEFEAQYPDRFWGKMGKVEWDVQFSKEGSENKGQAIKVNVDGKDAEIKSVARVWMTKKGEQEGKCNAICYILGENGQWYKETANKYRYDAAKNTSYYDLGKPEPIDANEQQVLLQEMLGEVKVPNKPDTTDARNKTKTVTFTTQVTVN